MRNPIVSYVAIAIAVVALALCFAQRREVTAREITQESERASARVQEAELLRRTKELVDANAQVTALLARIAVSQEEKNKADVELAKRVVELDKRTLMSVETINLAQKNAQDIQKMSQSIQEAFNAVGTTLHDFKEEFKLQLAANREELKKELEVKK